MCQPAAITINKVSVNPYTLDWRACFREIESENYEMCVTGPRAYFKRLRTSRDREFEKSGVNLLSYYNIEKKNRDRNFTSRDLSSSHQESPVVRKMD